MTNYEMLKKFSRATGITDEKVEAIVRQQESWIHEHYPHASTGRAYTVSVDKAKPLDFTTMAEAIEDIVKEKSGRTVSYKTYPYEKSDTTYDEWKDILLGDWRPHKAQERWYKSDKKFYSYNHYGGFWDRVHRMRTDVCDGIRYSTSETLRGDGLSYYDAEWREVKKPLMLEAHKEGSDDYNDGKASGD